MNVFVLCTGRCGSLTFSKACSHILNFTAAHESRVGLLGAERLAYPENHIEVDNRLSWFLGRLDQVYGDSAAYVHLTRNVEDVAASFVRRYEKGIIHAYRAGVLVVSSSRADPFDVAVDYCETVNSNIRSFLKNKSRQLEFLLEDAKNHFEAFWSMIGAVGDVEAAVGEFSIRYNASTEGGEHAER